MPLIVKLTPNVTDITLIAGAAEDGGADAISLINTLIGMSIDVQTKNLSWQMLLEGCLDLQSNR